MRLGGFRGVITILSGSVGAQVVAFVILPVLSRRFSDEAFGFLSLIVSVSAIVIPIAALRLESALMLPESLAETRSVTGLAILLTLATSVISFIIILFLVNFGVLESNHWSVAAWVSLNVCLTSFFTILSQLALRKHQYSAVATRSLVQSIGTACSQFLLSFVSRSGHMLVLGTLVGRSFGLIPLVRITKELITVPSWRQVKEVTRKYWRFPCIFTPSALMNALGLHAPLLFIISWFSLNIGGQLGMAERLIAIPLTLIGNSVAQVFEAQLAEKVRNKEWGIRSIFLKNSILLLGVGVLVFLVVNFFGGSAIVWFLGDGWSLTAELTKILALTMIFRIVANPISRVFTIFQKSGATIALDGIRILLLTVAILIVMLNDLEVVEAVILLYGALSLVYILTWLWAFSVVKNLDSRADCV